MPALESHIYDVFQQYSRLYQMRNAGDGELSPELQKEWIEVTFTLDSIFSGLYQQDPESHDDTDVAAELRNRVPVAYLRVPTDMDVLCETKDNFFSGKLQDISLGGAYVHAPVAFRPDSSVRLTFCTFRDREPLELHGRVAWSNPGGFRKQAFPEGAGIEFTDYDGTRKSQLEDYVYELVEDTLCRAHLI